MGHDERAAANGTVDAEPATQGGEPVAQANESAAARLCAADAVVAYFDAERVVLDSRADRRFAGASMLGDVRQCLGNHEVGRRLDGCGQTIDADVEVDGHLRP